VEDKQKNEVAMECRTPGAARREAYALAEHLVVVREKGSKIIPALSLSSGWCFSAQYAADLKYPKHHKLPEEPMESCFICLEKGST